MFLFLYILFYNAHKEYTLATSCRRHRRTVRHHTLQSLVAIFIGESGDLEKVGEQTKDLNPLT